MWIRGKGDTDFQPIAEQMWIEKRRELRMESRKLHILSSVLEKKSKSGAGRRILRGRRVMRGVIEIRKEGQGKSDWTWWGISNPNWKVSNGYLFFFLSGRPQGYFHCSHPLSLLCLSLNRLTSLVTPGYHMLLRNFGLHGLMATSPITPIQNQFYMDCSFQYRCQQPQSQLHTVAVQNLWERESDWSVSDQELTFCSTLLWPRWGSSHKVSGVFKLIPTPLQQGCGWEEKIILKSVWSGKVPQNGLL